VERVFGSVRYESTKNLTGHCLGAAGAVEAAICALRIENGDVRAALSNSFAFGGSNASVVLGVRG
jgi:3-oxoacyl-(acyl-carrier-protein) synthase